MPHTACLARPPQALDAALARALAAALALGLLLAGCGTPPRPVVRDGPPRAVPAGLDQVPDAVPRLEPLRVGGPNKPYEVLGRWYAPASTDIAWRERGLASWYGAKFHGRPTASGEVYDMFAMTAAHKTLPIPSYARVRNPASGREVIVRVNDRGPFVDGRIIDLSYTAALRLGLLGGVAPVEVVRLTHDEIRSGVWASARRPPSPLPPLPSPLPPSPRDDGDDPLGAMLVDRGLAPPPRP
jgi:rare lipoprotein A